MTNRNKIVILVGVCGTGKSVIGKKIAQRLEVPFFDVDKCFVPKEPSKITLQHEMHLEKWLTLIEELMANELNKKGCVISCSILKKEYRKRLSNSIDHQIDWVFMNDTFKNVIQRLKKNGNNDQPGSLLKSDFDTLEVPKRALTVDMKWTEIEIVDTILKYLARKYG